MCLPAACKYCDGALRGVRLQQWLLLKGPQALKPMPTKLADLATCAFHFHRLANAASDSSK